MPDAAYFTDAEIRARYPTPLSNATLYPDAAIDARRAEVEERMERLCDVAFVPRTITGEKVSGNGGAYLSVKHTKLIAITSAVDSGGNTIDLTDVATGPGDTFYLPAGWTQGVANLTVTYTHGYATIPAAVKEAAMLWVRELLVKGPVTDRATQIPTEDGGSINLATPGLFGVTTGIPAVDEVISEYRHQAFVG